VTLLGPPESSERRLNLAQSFNAVGAVVTPIIGAAFILSGIEHTRAQTAAMSSSQLQAYRAAEASTVKVPYLVIAGIFLTVAAMIYFAHLPEIQEQNGEQEPESLASGLRGIRRYGHLVKGVLAQFFYVGAQVGVASFVIRFAQFSMPGTPEKSAANYLKLHLLGFMLGRFIGSYVMKRVPAAKLLSLFGLGSLTCLTLILFGPGAASVWAIVVIGFFHSIMFPTIFALSLKHLGPYTKLGSSLLVMSIIGGAIFPALMGYISDRTHIRDAFVVPLLCHIYVLYFATRGYKPEAVDTAQTSRVVVPA
jgi:FHS family L-fucose permease-like MFS transporter